jgi:tetratricopeptide (TPR) repeat protein
VSADPAAFGREETRFASMQRTDPWLKLAAAYALSGRSDEAVRYFGRAIARADGYQTRKPIVELAARFHDLLPALIQHPAAAAGTGDLYAAAGDLERAIVEYRKLVTDRPADGSLLIQLATAYLSAGRTRDAVPYMARASANGPKDTGLSLLVAALQAWFGQEKELAATRQRIQAFAKNTEEAETAERAAKACSILPSTDRAELQAALVLAHSAMKLGNGPKWRCLLALGMAEYRSGNDAAADRALLAAAEAGPNDPLVTGISSFFRAMSLFRQTKKDEARKLAIAAAANMKPLPADERNPLSGSAGHNDLILWLAYKESKAMIRFDATPAPPETRHGK